VRGERYEQLCVVSVEVMMDRLGGLSGRFDVLHTEGHRFASLCL